MNTNVNERYKCLKNLIFTASSSPRLNFYRFRQTLACLLNSRESLDKSYFIHALRYV